MNMDNTNITTSEKLHLILDGESEGIDTAEVLNEVSNSPELTQEFTDLVRMKQMMRGATEAPPEHLRRGIMAGIGLGGSGLWYYLQNSGMVAASAAFVSSKVGAALIAGMVGVFATFMIMDNSDKPNTLDYTTQSITNSQYTELASAMPIVMEVPVVSSKSKNTNTRNSSSQVTRRYNENQSSVNSNTSQVATNSESTIAENNFFEVSESKKAYNTNENVQILPTSSESLAANQEILPSIQSERPSGFIINPTNRIMSNETEQQMLFSLQGRGISNNSLQAPNLSTTEAPAINDIGIALMYSVNDEFELGLEFGQEFFVKKIKSNTFNSEETMLENQLTFWGGVRATYKFNDMQILDGFRPMTSILIGGTNRGWVTRASAGLVYDISNKLTVFGGPEWTSGFYQFDSKLLSTHKWGFQYGLALKF
ncbi:MAG: hypothetical protein CVV25_07870 [Ignavibacteriae bacterium HGW-Ignavibacteriae-4]|jgi:hypothetical protein|nr:MAG: hypothetical protein CVV25_07870 [Ignavibacteriae bacterium HGW-Ignavibacteriae-4]